MVLVARYEVEGRRMRDGRRLGLVWWNQMVGFRRGDGMVVGLCFDDHLGVLGVCLI